MVIDFDGETYNLDVDELNVSEAMAIKVKTGYNLLQWQAALEEGDPLAAKALYWLMLAQNGVRGDIDLLEFKVVKFLAAVGAAATEGKTSEANPTKVPRNAG